ncbi:LutB/LldF family L-lactate oxidation iron-sulfur protein [Planctomycetota bacterium]
MLEPNHNLKQAIHLALDDPYLQQALNTHPVQRTQRVDEILTELGDVQKFRELARQIKDYTLDHLDELLAQLADQLQKLGGQVHWAADDRHARQIILDIAQQHNCRLCVKSKSMVSEEIDLAAALIKAGIETVETDLGEFIIQLNNERPSHIITPSLHVSRKQVAQLFQDKLGAAYTENEEELTQIARRYLRDKFQQADLGITGVNFAVAETGSLAIVTNEGNGRYCTARPPLHIALMGMEKVISTPADLAVMLKLLARNAVGTRTSVYTNVVTGPARPGEPDGPEHLHLVILDNGRSNVLAGPHRQLLRCLRCGACLNNCPVYRKIGGHAYGAVYPGPIGAALVPLLKSFDQYTPEMVELSSLCGACLENCPVMIDIPRILINMRRELNEKKKSSLIYRLGLAAWTWFYSTEGRYRFYQRWLRRFLLLMSRRGWLKWAPPPASAWTHLRDVPLPAKHLFRDIWKKSNGKP